MGGQRLSDGRLWNREKVAFFKELLLLGQAGTARRAVHLSKRSPDDAQRHSGCDLSRISLRYAGYLLDCILMRAEPMTATP